MLRVPYVVKLARIQRFATVYGTASTTNYGLMEGTWFLYDEVGQGRDQGACQRGYAPIKKERASVKILDCTPV